MFRTHNRRITFLSGHQTARFQGRTQMYTMEAFSSHQKSHFLPLWHLWTRFRPVRGYSRGSGKPSGRRSGARSPHSGGIPGRSPHWRKEFHNMRSSISSKLPSSKLPEFFGEIEAVPRPVSYYRILFCHHPLFLHLSDRSIPACYHLPHCCRAILACYL